jgi:hypothetical protein
MARVHERKARKDYPAQGIKKGDTYFTWKTRMTVGKSYVGRIHRSLTRPVLSQLTSSTWRIRLDAVSQSIAAAEDADGLRAAAEELRELGNEQREKFDNMPEGLQQGDTGQTLEQQADDCESAADEIDAAADTLGEALEAIDTAEAAHEELAAAWDAHDEDPVAHPEPDEEDPRDRDYAQERQDAMDEAVSEAEGPLPS